MDELKILSEEPMFWSRIGMAWDPTKLDENGNIVFYDEDWTEFLREHRDFFNIGVRVHTSVIHNGWIGVDRYDYSAVDRTLEAICSISPDILYMPRIKLNPPIEWSIDNPTEMMLNFTAPRTPEKIRELAKKLAPYYTTGGLEKSAPKDEGIAGLMSFSSEKWIADASVALEKLIKHIDNSKYASQIIAYQICFGMCGETSAWGAWNDCDMWGDYGITNSENFYRYCLEKYKSNEKIAEAYKLSRVDENICLVPHPEKRKLVPKTIEEYFRADNPAAIDYSIFLSEKTTDAVCRLAKVAKQVGKKPVGAFYGYLTVSYPAETGHLGVEKLLNCDDLDFIASPKGYYRCGPGEPGGTQTTSMSIRRKKLFLDELDNDTHISKKFQDIKNHPANLDETKTVLWREVAKNLSWGEQNFWWMDLYGGWFCDRDIMAEFEKLTETVKRIRKKRHESISEILYVVDEKSLAYQNCDSMFMGGHHKGIVNELAAELHLCGAPVDECRLSDIVETDLSRYKVIVFANAFKITSKMRDFIKSHISADTLCIWNYAAGIWSEKFDIANVQKLTGMEIVPFDADFSLNNGYGVDAKLPPIQIKEESGLEVVARYNDGKINAAKRGNNLLVCAPYMRAEDFHNIAKSQGCHMYAPHGCTVFADNRFIGVFPREDRSEVLDLGEGKYREIISDKIFSGDTPLKSKGHLMFEKM